MVDALFVNLPNFNSQVCLLAVGDSQVWAGSFDGMIYVIDIGTRTCNQRLSEHTDHVCDITRTDDSR